MPMGNTGGFCRILLTLQLKSPIDTCFVLYCTAVLLVAVKHSAVSANEHASYRAMRIE